MALKSTGKSHIVELLRSHDVYPTQQRVEIGRIVLARSQHLSADQVMAMVNSDGRAVVSKATVYNTLGLFADKGLVREVIVDPAKVFYDSNTSTHHHFYNKTTGELADIEADQLVVNNLPELPAGAEIDGVDVVIRIHNKA